MGINQSKGSVDITSTPNKGKVADDIVKPETNGKTIDEKIITDEKPKVITYTYFWKKGLNVAAYLFMIFPISGVNRATTLVLY